MGMLITSAHLLLVILAGLLLGVLLVRAFAGSELVKRTMFLPMRCLKEFRRALQLRKMDGEMHKAIAIMGDALRSGQSIQASIGIVGGSLRGPLGVEFKRASAALASGVDLGDVLTTMQSEIGLEDFHVFAESIDILRRVGGNVVETMELMVCTLEERRRVENRLKTSTAEARTQAIVLLALPWALLVALCFMGSGFADPLLYTRLGNILLVLAMTFELAGALWLKKIVEARV